MDNIQFWLYLGFGLIYFITRQMKKKKKQAEEARTGEQPTEKPFKKPVTFDELLKEFTQEPEEETPVDDYAEQQRRIEEARKEQEEASLRRRENEEKKRLIEQDHTSRRFADEESRMIYEKSIAQAEGADLKFERDEHFKTAVNIKDKEEEEDTFGSEILSMLQDADQAKKAVVLSEILNRKY